MWYIVKNKPCKSSASKFDLIKCFLAEESLEEWETREATLTNRVVLVPTENFPDKLEDKTESTDQKDQSDAASGTDKSLE